MKPYALIFFSFLLGVTLVFSCTKDKEDPPSACCDCLKPATQTGHGTMSMRINGRPWSNCNPKNPNFGTVSAVQEQTKFAIQGRRLYENVESKEDFYILLPELYLGEYFGFKGEYLFRLFFIKSSRYNTGEYSRDTSKPCNIFITKLDYNNRIVSGTFDCWMVKQWGNNAPDSLHITEGNFDTRF